ncbi:MAG: Formylmethanofuran dehydrogenase subunit E region [Promethearchaeota archaeon]|nr:MAG: Formylmethanofuran dehydrogenase subunit E region [Candidatus Lokiarchaeota archaeon]
MIEVREIGRVKSKFKERKDPFEMKKHKSSLIIDKEYEEGLYRIEERDYIQVLFNFHLSQDYKLKGPTYNGEVRGVFASRSPHRPSSIGLTTVKLLERRDNELIVKGLDAIDGTPILDIKPFSLSMDDKEKEEIGNEYNKKNPRVKILKLIRAQDLKSLLIQAASLHGHFCPGLALGVMAGSYSIKKMGWRSEGLENILSIVETNNCFSDGIQYTTGCTFGNNSLIYRDYGKTAFTLTQRDGEGMRMIVKKNFYETLQRNFPEYAAIYEKVITKRENSPQLLTKFRELAQETSFAIIKYDIEQLFDIQQIETSIPEYARMHDSLVCDKCGESFMETRMAKENHQTYCIPCGNGKYHELNGEGIITKS